MNIDKLFKGLSVLILISALVSGFCYRRDFVPYLFDSQARDQQMLDVWRKAYENDTYGGKTPEETLALFVDALKKGDIDLASKYFLIDEQKGQLDKLGRLNEKERHEASERVSLLVKQSEDSSRSVFLFKSDETILGTVVLVKSTNGFWKISDL